MLKVTACPLLVLAVSFVATGGTLLTETLIVASFETPPSLSATV